MKRVVISGYYGYDNIGDEALLKAIIDALRSFDKELHITVLSAKPEKTAKNLGVDAVNRTSLVEIVSSIRSCDLLISGGGSLLQDVTGPLTIPYYLGIVAIAKMLNKRVMFYAQGIGPVKGTMGRQLIKLLVNKVDMVTLRDKESAELLKEIGVFKPPVKVTADPVFGLNESESKDSVNVILNKYGIDADKGNLVGIAIRSWPNYENALKAIAEAVDYLYNRGRQAVLIPMHYPADITAAKELQRLIKKPSILIEENLSPDSLLSLIGNMDFIIGMRLHSLIFGAVKGVPLIGISYDPKVDQFLQTPGCISAGDINTIKSDALIKNIDYIIENREAVSRLLTEHCGKLREKALENAELVMKLLNK